MYLIVYQKQNGEIINRKRNSLPTTKIGEETSMGWIIKDILFQFNNKYYPFAEYKKLCKKRNNVMHIYRNVKSYFKKYSVLLSIIAFLPLIILK